MNIRRDLRMSKAAFLEWDAGEEQRCELVGGRVVTMPRPSQAHGMIVMNLGVLLRTRLAMEQWIVIQDFGLDTGPETLRDPDLIVYPAGSPGHSYTTSKPVLLAEVLSPSNAEVDFGDKTASISSFQAFSPTLYCRSMNRKPGCGPARQHLRSSRLHRK
jgi:Uma2 family endonuclease